MTNISEIGGCILALIVGLYGGWAMNQCLFEHIPIKKMIELVITEIIMVATLIFFVT